MLFSRKLRLALRTTRPRREPFRPAWPISSCGAAATPNFAPEPVLGGLGATPDFRRACHEHGVFLLRLQDLEFWSTRRILTVQAATAFLPEALGDRVYLCPLPPNSPPISTPNLLSGPPSAHDSVAMILLPIS